MEEGTSGLEPLRLTVPNTRHCLPTLRDAAGDAARLAGFDAAGAAYAARVAGRLAARLLDPALDPPEDGAIDLECRREGGGLLVTLHDDGPPFDPAQGGRAEEIVHALLRSDSPDWIAFRNRGRGGREISALLHAPGTPADGATAAAAPELEDEEHSLLVRASEPSGAWLGRVPDEFAAAPPAPVGATESEIDLMLMRPEQAAAVSRCIFDAYRLTYFDEMMYRPAQLAELNRTGDMVSAVAVAPDGTVVGHVALEFAPGERAIADAAAAVTLRTWRGHGVAERLVAFLIEEAQRRGMAGLWCDAVTVHPFTQRLAHSLGFIPCGFHLGFETAQTRFFGINDQPEHRGSSVVMFRPVDGLSTTPLDVPARHRELVAGIYARLGAPDRLSGSAPSGTPAAETDMAVLRHDVLGVCRLTIRAPGGDLPKRLDEELKAAAGGEFAIAEVRLNLQAAGAAAAANALEDLGFMVTGVLPGGAAADWLLLQRCFGVLIDYDGMAVDAPESRELLAIIRAGDPDAH